MAVTKNTTQGQKFSYDTETALGTAAGAPVDFRPEEFTFPKQITQAYMPISGGFTNPADKNKAIPYKDGSGTGTLSMLVRRATTTLTPSVATFMESGGWTRASLTPSTTVAALTAVDSLVLAADNACENGSFVLVEMASGAWEPVHVAAWTLVGTTAVPVFDMSAVPTTGNAVQQMHTLYPQSGTLGATEALTFIHLTRATDATPNPQEWTHGGCACILKTIEIVPNEPWKFTFDVLIANTDVADGTWSVETDHEVVGIAMVNNDFEFLIEDANAAGAGGIARTSMGIRKVTIETGCSAEKITSVGGSTDLNSVGGYTIKLEQPTWTVDGWFDITRIEDWKTSFVGGTGTNIDVALMAVSSSQDYLLYPACAVSSPLCNLLEAPDVATEGTDSGLVEMTLKFGATGAGLNAADGPTDAGDQAIYVGISGQLA